MIAPPPVLPAVLWVSLAALSLRVGGLRRAGGRYLGAADADAQDPAWREEAGAWFRALERTRFLPWSTCLTRSLALCRKLARRGHSAALRFGGVLDPRGFQAHAWVEVGGESFGRNGFEAMAPVAARSRGP